MAIEVQNIEVDGQPLSVEITDGTNILGTVAHPVRTDPTGTTTQPISGNVTTTPVVSNTATITQVVLTANTNATLLVTNANRKKFIVFVPKSTTYIKYGTTASATSFTWAVISNNATVDDTIWTGNIDVFSTVNQTVTVTELI